MKLNRRSFVAILTGAAAAPKKVIAGAIPHSISALSLEGIRSGTDSVGMPMDADKSWAKKALKRWFNPMYAERKRREFSIHALDPDVHALRSVSLPNKVRLSRERQFTRYMKLEKSYLERVLSGEEEL